jgi:hypothetical protein
VAYREKKYTITHSMMLLYPSTIGRRLQEMHESKLLNGLRNKTEEEIHTVCMETFEFLIEKNRAYGNSALDPVRIFSKSGNTEQLMVRIDDKLSRFARGSEFPGDNDIDDLLGYLVLLKVAHRNNWR